MRTNIEIDDALLQEAMSLGHVRTKKDLVHEALRTYIKIKQRKDLTELAGRVDLDLEYDHKHLRDLRS